MRGTDYDATAETHFFSALNPSGVVTKTGESSFSTLLGDASDSLNNNHYVVTVDLSDFMPLNAGADIWLHYAEECGNDSMRGLLRVPDGGSSALLTAFGVTAFAFARRDRKSS